MVPDRAILPLSVGLMGGLFCGLLDSILQLQGAPVVTLAVVGAITAAASGAVSVIGEPGRGRAGVAVLRAFYAAALFLCVDLGLQAFLRDGRAILALVLILAAFGSAAMLMAARLRPPQPPRGASPQASA